MANNEIKTRIKQRYDTFANWQSKNPILLEGEVARVRMEDNTVRTKTGNGTAIKFNDLAWDDKNLYDLNTSNAIGVSKDYVDEQAAGKLDKVSSYVRIYPGVYATTETDGTPHLITATSDLGYIGNGSGYIPLYAAGGQLKTATPTSDDSAANKGYVDGKIAALTNKYELIETITLTEATASIERSVEPDGTAYNFKKLFIYTNASLTEQAGYFGVHLWDGTTLAAKNLAFGSPVKTTSSHFMMELSVEDGILRQTAPDGADKDYLSTTVRTAAATFFGGAKMMDKISKIRIHHFNSLTFAAGTVIKIYGVRA